MSPKWFRNVADLVSGYTRRRAHMHEVQIFVILHLRAYSLTAFCMQKMLKIPQTVEEVSFLKLTVSTFFFAVSYFGLILLYNNIKVAIYFGVLWSKVFLARA